MTPPVVGYILKRFPRLSETFVLRELLELERMGVGVRVFALGRPDETTVHADCARLRAPVVYVDDVPLSPPNDAWQGPVTADADRKSIMLARRLMPVIAAAGVTHLHAHFATVAAEVARQASRALSIPYSFTAHAKDIFHESVSTPRLETLIREAAFVVTVSDFNVRHLRHAAPRACGTEIHRVYNGVDTATFRFTDAERPPDRLLGVGRLVEKKGFDVFIDAVAQLHRRRPSLQATIVGTGRCEADLRTRIERHGVAAHVTMAGSRRQTDVLDMMRTHTVLAAPCVVGPDGDKDGLPTVIIEAMAMGLPVVSTPVTGIPEIVRHGITGLLVPEGNPAALADAIDSLFGNPDLCARLRTEARRLVESEFDTRKNAQALADLLTASATDMRGVTGSVGRVAEAAAR
jgi:glycosyltransferase involved in cell wall biosynthesis